MKVKILAADFNREIVDEMIRTAEAECQNRGWEITGLLRVPGCYELPLVAAQAVTDVDALVILGYIEKGETMHGEVMGHVVHSALVDLQLRTSKPIGLGIVGPGATVEQARVRAAPSATSAVNSVAVVAEVMRS